MLIIFLVLGAICLGITTPAGAVAYSRLVTMSGTGEWFSSLVTSLEVNRWLVLLLMQGVFFILGMLLDPAGIILITGPFFLPVIYRPGLRPPAVRYFVCD